MIARGRIAIAAAFAFVAAASAQQPARDRAPAPAAGAATISGNVLVNGDTRQPARRVRVTLNEVALAVPGQTTTTDDAGAFMFRGVPAGRFELKAFKPAYLTASYGASRPERPGTPIVVKDGDKVGLTISIVRGGVITGAVRDARGRPMPGIAVRVLRFSYSGTGERTLAAPSLGSTNTTDDRGEYRAYGLPPGSYLVLANPVQAGRPIDRDIQPLTSADVERALQAARAGVTAPGATPPAPLPVPAARVNYAPVFHPGVTDIRSAATIALGLSEERAGIDVSVQLAPTAIISGTVSVPGSSALPPVDVRLLPAGGETDLLAGTGVRIPSTQVTRDGTYSFSGIAPGLYNIRASTLPSGRGGGARPGPALWAAADVAVSGQNLTVPLTLQPGVTINGRVVFEGSAPPPAELQTMSFKLVAPGSGGQPAPFTGGKVDADGRFTFTGVTPDTYRFLVQWTSSQASALAMKASTANGREALDAPIAVSANETLEWTITFTDKPSGIAGTLQDRTGRAAADYYVVVFSADRAFWTPGSRRIRMLRPATDGAFSAKGLIPGDYFLAALTDLEPGEWNDPALLDELAGSAIKLTVRDGEMTKQDLRIGDGLAHRR